MLAAGTGEQRSPPGAHGKDRRRPAYQRVKSECVLQVSVRGERFKVRVGGYLAEGFFDGLACSVTVPDLIEEMAVAALGDGAQVEAAANPPGGIAARLRFPLATWEAPTA